MELEWSLLESNQRLQREKCVRDVGKLLATDGLKTSQSVEMHADSLLGHQSWEGRHGGLLLVQEYMKWQQQSKTVSEKSALWVDKCLELLSDKEVRVRTASGETLALLCRQGGMHLYDEKVAMPLLESIERNMTLERDGQAFLDDDEATKKLTEKLLAGEAARQMKASMKSRSSRASSMQSTVFHDTAGWGTLETDVMCLQQIMEKSGAAFAPRLTSEGEILELLCNAALHMNRFVRATAFKAIDAAIKSLHEAGRKTGDEADSEFLLDSVAKSSDLAARLGSGLCDEWANVRMEASVALRTFLELLETLERREAFYEELLPKLCLNRYFVATGVATYTRDTWKLIIADTGRETVVKWLPSIVPFYIMQTRVANSEARQAATKCIAELAARVDRDAVSVYATDLFQALITRLKPHDAWEVKESACIAIQEFARAFPERFSLSTDFPQLVPSLSAAIADTVLAVRQGAAQTLAELVNVSDEQSAGPIFDLCLDGLKSASRELDERGKYGTEDFSSLKHERDNDLDLHSNQEAIDCCAVGDLDEDDSEQLSLSKIYNQAQRDKLDMGLNKWERTDGCLYLVQELAASGRYMASDKWDAALKLLASVSSLRHFVKHVTLLATLWKVLPALAKALGAEVIKRHLPNFADSLDYSVLCEDELAVNAAKTCLLELDRCLGHESFCECIKNHDDALLDRLLANLPPPLMRGKLGGYSS